MRAHGLASSGGVAALERIKNHLMLGLHQFLALHALEQGEVAHEGHAEQHLAVARASGNQFFISAIASMQAQVLLSMTLMRNLSLLKSVERQKLVQAEHEVLLAALQRRDALAAGLAMRTHLENAKNRMFGK